MKMTERWKRELTKLRGAPELPADLWARVGLGPRMDVAHPLSWRRAATIVVAFAVVIPILVFAWIALRSLHGGEIVPSGSDVLDVPPIGQVAPANMADGRPVFVVHDAEGTVSVVDGLSTHAPFGLAKVIGWCPTSRTFDDLFHGSMWTESGNYIAGPAPTGLVTYGTTMLPDGQVNVGPAIAPAPRGAGGTFRPAGAFCQTSANIIYPTLPTQVFDSPSAVVAASPSGWVAMKGILVEEGARAELCSPLSQGSECQDAAVVNGLDVSGLFGGNPDARFPGTFIARVVDGSLVDLARVPMQRANDHY
jgi:hypothetical protein